MFVAPFRRQEVTRERSAEPVVTVDVAGGYTSTYGVLFKASLRFTSCVSD